MNHQTINNNNFLKAYLPQSDNNNASSSLPSLKTLTRDYLNYLLSATNYNLNEIATLLCINQNSLKRKIQKLNCN